MKSALTAARKRLLAAFEAALLAETAGWKAWPEALAEPMRYSLFGGGKRVRPLLALLAAEATTGDAHDALPWAAAIEMIHTYSLVHDDLPAMDDDDERRGRPTCHIAFGEAHAILAGDALLTEAFGVLARANWPAERAIRLVRLAHEAAGSSGMIAGQVLDIGGAVRTLAQLETMQRLKTGALIRAACMGGAIAVGATAAQVEALAQYGAAIGLLFQITDDLLDAAQDAEGDGRNVLHHMDLNAVHAWRDNVAAEAIDALQPLGDAAATLAELAHFVAHRQV
ncbi:MAG: polyprenyl synthetase family protein [Myxococcales bacterium]|nr:polyprenyl synthetase family protein [Myxococcales bacterium]